MTNSYDSFDNTEINFRKDALIQERVGLVSSHMYKQFLDYQSATINTAEVFSDLILDMKAVIESLRKSFSSRGITSQNVYCEVDSQKSVITANILWHTISFTTRCNFGPQALYREQQTPLLCGRIMAIKGNYFDILKGAEDKSECMKRLLGDEVEIASLYIPSDKMQNSILKVRHLANREFFLNSQDSAKEFVLRVIEIVCGGGLYHDEGSIKTFNL